MKIQICEDKALADVQINICCSARDERIEEIVFMLEAWQQRLVVRLGQETVLLPMARVLYIESVDRQTFVYTKEAVYESGHRLYMLEEQLKQYGFFRASKSTIINLRQVRRIQQALRARLLVTMENGEKIGVSRQYAKQIKQELGLYHA